MIDSTRSDTVDRPFHGGPDGAALKACIAIVNHNTGEPLDRCITSVEEQTRHRHQIVVVDNASKINPATMLGQKHPRVKVIVNSRNMGFAKANNQAFRTTIAKYNIMLNPDTIILDGALDKVIDFMDERADIAVCGPRHIDQSGHLQYSCDHFPSSLTTLWLHSNLANRCPGVAAFRRSKMMYWDYNGVRDVETLMGSCLAIRSGLYRELHGLDERYFMYFEETDLCYRIAKLGFRIVYLPDAEIIHLGGESSKRVQREDVFNKTIFQHFLKSQYYFFKKNYGIFPMIAIRVVDFAYGFVLFFRSVIRSDRARSEKGRRKATFMMTSALGGQ